MKMKKFGSTERTVRDLVQPIVEDLGYSLWDVSFEKEGAYWYLRIFADRPEGMTIEDCENLTRPINEVIDKADPISQAYVLEVGSAGLERELNQLWHLEVSIGKTVRARAILKIQNKKEWVGVLQSFDDTQIILELPESDRTVALPLKELSYIRWYVEVDF
ncbi:MAG: ribosome maturation factor RimP [Ruminococcus sp.]|nr:ribosome maturation factor RimP [Ruminococcus sp.]